MGILSGQFTEQDKAFDANNQDKAQLYKPTAFDNYIHSPVAGSLTGLMGLPNTVDRMINGDEGADKRMARTKDQLKPTAKSASGEFLYGMGEVLAPAMVASPLGVIGMGTAAYGSSYSLEHSRLTQELQVDDDTADKAASVYATSNAVLTALPVSNFFKPVLKDYLVAVGGTTVAAQAATYVEGDILARNGYLKQGDMYKDMSTDPTAIGANLILGSAFFAYGRLRNNPNVTQDQVNQAGARLDDLVDAEIAVVDKGSIPTNPKNVGDSIQHQNNLNTAIDQVMKGEKVNISEATGGEFKTMQDLRSYLQSNKTTNNKPIDTLINTPKSESKQAVNFNLKANVSSDQKVRVSDSYKAAQQAGFTPSQARALVGELGRENDFNINTMFGSHNDPARGYNLGIFSWQDNQKGQGRRTNLVNFLSKKGLMNPDGTIKRTNEALVAQFEFLKSEIAANPKWKASFLDQKNISNDEARAALGGVGTVIGWARGQTTIRKADGSRVPFNWKSQEDRANRYSNMVDGEAPITSHAKVEIDENNSVPPTINRDISDLNGTVNPKVDLNDNVDILTNNRPTEADFDLYSLRNDPDRAVKALEEDLAAFNSKTGDSTSNPSHNSKLETDIPNITKKVEVPPTADKQLEPIKDTDTTWTQNHRYEQGKRHTEESRMFIDKDGNVIQELKYKDTYVRRKINKDHQTESIHVAQKGKSDLANLKGNKDIEVALDRTFNHRNYGYLSQVPKGQETISKLENNPNTVIHSKATGEDLTASQWQQRLQHEQNNIQTLSKAMKTLAQCALKNVA